MDVAIRKDANGNVPSMCMNEHGITLRHGKHKGRLLRPARHYAGRNDRSLWPKHYTTAIYSDGGGNPWRGMLFGMTVRYKVGGTPEHIWKFWDDLNLSFSPDSEITHQYFPGLPSKLMEQLKIC